MGIHRWQWRHFVNTTANAGKVAAVFDIDNTLLPKTTSERVLIKYLIQHGQYGLSATMGTLTTVVRHANLGPSGALRIYRPYLRHRTVAEVAQFASHVFRTRIQPRLAPEAIARVQWHHRQGHHLAVLSGAPQFLATLIADYLGINTVIGTPLAVVDGRYTGALAGLHPYGPRKSLLVQQFATEQQIDLTASYGYADHHTDAEFLSLFGHPTCVNPTQRLRQIASRKGWPIAEWAAPAG